MNTNSGTLHLNPRFPVVWRSPTALQLGIDTPLVRFEGISHAEECMLHALGTGVSLEGLRMIGARSRGGPRSAARLLERVAPALLRPEYGEAATTLTPTPLAGRTIAVAGSSSVRPAVQALLAELGAIPFTRPSPRPRPIPHPGPGGPSDDPDEDLPAAAQVDLAVIVSSWSTPPTEAASWLRNDIPHFDVVFSDSAVTVGPLVSPGLGPCLHCRERWHIDRDSSWPAIAGQLYGRPAPTELPLTIARVLPVVAELCLKQFLGRPPGVPGHPDRVRARYLEPGVVVHVDAINGALSESRQAVHPECACQALPGIATENEPATGSLRSLPTRGATVAVPA